MKSKQGKETFCRLRHETMDTDAFLNLSNGATRLLLLLFRRYDGFNNGSIPCGERDVRTWCHCGPATALAYFKELQEAGLIKRTRKGAYHRFGKRAFCTISLWRLNFVK